MRSVFFVVLDATADPALLTPHNGSISSVDSNVVSRNRRFMSEDFAGLKVGCHLNMLNRQLGFKVYFSSLFLAMPFGAR